ncbi:MAG: glycosyltransferase [Planctomycetes bacterium]|nr:glycosyltransferase [Planctomycetota bacterium]
MTTELPLTIVVPVFHEEGTIGKTLAEVAAKITIPHRLLVVYDYDEDPTVPVVEALLETYPNVELLRNDLGKGVINAIKKGFGAATHPGALVVVMADLSDDLAAVSPMYRLIQAGYDLVAGSRYCPGGSQEGGGLIKSSLSRLAGRSLHALTSIPTRDVTNAFRMYRTSFLRSVEVESQGGFELSLELTVKAWAQGYRVGEVPSQWRDRADGESKFQLVAWLPSYIRWYLEALGHQYLGRQPGSGPISPGGAP